MAYGRRHGVRVGGLTPRRARKSGEPGGTAHIDLLYREWVRDRTDVDRLGRLYNRDQ